VVAELREHIARDIAGLPCPQASRGRTVEVLLRTPAAAAARFRDCTAGGPGFSFPRAADPVPARRQGQRIIAIYWELDVIILGVILLIIGFIAKIAIVWTIGIIVLVVGAILALLGMMGHAVGGRRHYY
jgi:Family of unknown function (DUF6131)